MYDIGDVYPATVTIRDVNGTPTPATGMTFTFALPDGTTITPSPSNPTTGVYTYDLPITQRGLHRFRAAATTPAAAYNDAFTAVDTTWPAFVGLGEVKQHLNIPTTTTTDDEELRGFILSASAGGVHRGHRRPQDIHREVFGAAADRARAAAGSGHHSHVGDRERHHFDGRR